MKVHFIAIGGSAMHNLAIALQKKGYEITGSDDEIYEPSKTRLANFGLLPQKQGWNPDLIHEELDAVILGMHAREDNPELKKAKELGLKIFSYPEYLYEQTKHKTRIAIGGSHGKTTITSMVIHVLNYRGIKFDFMVGAQLENFDNMVSLSEESKIAVFEGDEYLSSALDPRPKFLIYKPHIALISGIAWDHVNVFSTFSIYVEQFKNFIQSIEHGGQLVYCADDPLVAGIALTARNDITLFPYYCHPYEIDGQFADLLDENKKIPLKIFGKHNMQNIAGAKEICKLLGINDKQFYEAITKFKGATKRLQLIGQNKKTSIYLDFAHAPSKVQASIRALKEQFSSRQLIACLELHTFSSLINDFLQQYYGTMERADMAYVYFNPHLLEIKRLKPLDAKNVAKAFSSKHLKVFTDSKTLLNELRQIDWKDKNLLLMSSGNFDGINFSNLINELMPI
jgi:UDP-N-acetylmuramate: L-alanyl-gamma-D-glutamyl-meso-diaminopimelate ligase